MRKPSLKTLSLTAGGIVLLAGVAWLMLTPQTPIAEWRECIHWEYIDRSDPYVRDTPHDRDFDSYRDHNVIFHGKHVPVPPNTAVWYLLDRFAWARTGGEHIQWLEGADADLFSVEYRALADSEYGEWQGTAGMPGSSDFYLATWFKPDDQSGNPIYDGYNATVIANTQELAEGEYTFDLYLRHMGYYKVNCGRGRIREPSKFKVIVDRDRPTVPTALTGITVSEQSTPFEADGWILEWEHIEGVGEYFIETYIPHMGGEYVLYRDYEPKPEWSGDMVNVHIRESATRLRCEKHYYIGDTSKNVCGDGSFYVRIYAIGDRVGYLDARSEPSEPVRLQLDLSAP